jgi:hypothetical protein
MTLEVIWQLLTEPFRRNVTMANNDASGNTKNKAASAVADAQARARMNEAITEGGHRGTPESEAENLTMTEKKPY